MEDLLIFIVSCLILAGAYWLHLRALEAAEKRGRRAAEQSDQHGLKPFPWEHK